MTTKRADSWVEALKEKPRSELTSDEEAWLGIGSDIEAEQRAARSAAAMVAKTCAVRPFPATASRVIDLTSRTEKHVREVVRVIETDPTLATRILRYVNSAACGLKVRCKSLYHAVTLLGPRRIRELVTSTAVLSMFERGDALSTEILEHAAVTGALARLVGERFGLPSEEMLTCGLLHDLGKLMMLDSGDTTYAQLLGLGVDDETLCKLEREEYGFDHAVLAGQMLLKWNIPAPIPRVVAWHHQPGRAHQMNGRIPLMVEVLRFADFVADGFALGDDRAALVTRVAASPSAAYLDLGVEEIDRVYPLLARVHRESRALFHGDEVPLSELEVLPAKPTAPKAKPIEEAPREELHCALCNELTYGRQCPSCRRPVCEAHDPGAGFCNDCEDQFARASDPIGSALLGTVLIGTAAAMTLMAFGIFFDIDLSIAMAAALASCIVSGTAAATRRWQRRRAFRPAFVHEVVEAAPRPKTAIVRADEFEAPLLAAMVPDPEGKRLVHSEDLVGLVPPPAPSTATIPAPPPEHVEEPEADIDSPEYVWRPIKRTSGSVPYSDTWESALPAVPILRQQRAPRLVEGSVVKTTLPPEGARASDSDSKTENKQADPRLARVG